MRDPQKNLSLIFFFLKLNIISSQNSTNQYDPNNKPHPCSVSPSICINSGTCIETYQDNPSFKCLCKHGYTGDYCQNILEPCRSKPCKNKSYCQMIVDDYYHEVNFVCHCKSEQYSGELCQFDHSKSNNFMAPPSAYNCPCKNGQPCGPTGACQCSFMFMGPECQYLNPLAQPPPTLPPSLPPTGPIQNNQTNNSNSNYTIGYGANGQQILIDANGQIVTHPPSGVDNSGQLTQQPICFGVVGFYKKIYIFEIKVHYVFLFNGIAKFHPIKL